MRLFGKLLPALLTGSGRNRSRPAARRRTTCWLLVERLEDRTLMSGETIGPWVIAAAPISARLIAGGTFPSGWLNVVNAPVSYNEAFSGFSIIDRGYANLSSNTIIEMTFA